jgi:hypothetical protein
VPAAQVRLIWGLQGMDMRGKALWDAADLGQLAFDSSFDPSSAQAQLFLLQACLRSVLQPRVRLLGGVLHCRASLMAVRQSVSLKLCLHMPRSAALRAV